MEITSEGVKKFKTIRKKFLQCCLRTFLWMIQGSNAAPQVVAATVTSMMSDADKAACQPSVKKLPKIKFARQKTNRGRNAKTLAQIAATGSSVFTAARTKMPEPKNMNAYLAILRARSR